MGNSGRRRRNGFVTWEPGPDDGAAPADARVDGRTAAGDPGAGQDPQAGDARGEQAEGGLPPDQLHDGGNPLGAPGIGDLGGPSANPAVGQHGGADAGADPEPGAAGQRGDPPGGGRSQPENTARGDGRVTGHGGSGPARGGSRGEAGQRRGAAAHGGGPDGSARGTAVADGGAPGNAAAANHRGAGSRDAGGDRGGGIGVRTARQGADADDRGYPGDRGSGGILNGHGGSGAREATGDGNTGAYEGGDGRLPAQPGVTMAKTHLSSAPPDLGPVHRSLDENKAILDAVMGVGTSFDVIFRELRFGDTRVAVYVVNGMYETVSNLVLMNMTEWLTDLGARRHDLPQAETGAGALHALFQARLAFAQVTKTKSLDDVAFNVMAGPLAILVDGADEAIVVDTREYPDRQPDEPVTERVTRGPHDGFIETLVFNTTLVRRRIRDPRLHFAIQQAGVRTQMDVAVGYIEGLTDPALVQEVQRRIKSIDIDEITMAERTVAEYLAQDSWNPFPTTRMTERPDVAAYHLMEGHVIVLVDTTPQAIICPATLWNHLQHPEDFHLSPFMGTYMRWVQFIGLFFATMIPPLWLVIAIDPRIVHALPALAFIGPKKPSGFPLGLQFIGAEVTLDLLRRAILNTPGTLSATMGILGAIVLGDVAAKTGIFSSEVLVYIVLAAIGQFAISNLELGMAARIVRLSLLIAVWALRLPGLLIGTLIWLLVLLGTRTFGIPYTWPLLPFDWGAFRGMLIREPAHARGQRPLVLRVQNRSRQ